MLPSHCCVCRKTHVITENETLKEKINYAITRRLEASCVAKKLAEANFHLENCYCEICTEIQRLKEENEKMINRVKRKAYQVDSVELTPTTYF